MPSSISLRYTLSTRPTHQNKTHSTLLMAAKTLLIAFLTGAALSSAEAASFKDSITGQGLLGSHFGVPGLASSYDYIVLGGGTAGLTIARRLAEKHSVAVIEAGDFLQFSNGNLSEIPAYASYFTGNSPTLKNPNLDWYMFTEPQPVSDYCVELYLLELID